MKRVVLYLLLSGWLLFPASSHAQTYTITHSIPWETTNQNMWGPNGTPFNIDVNISLFDLAFDTAMSMGVMDTVFGAPFGAAVNMDTWFEIGSDFVMEGFTTGWIDVNYPVEIHLTFPDNYTYNPGEWVTVNSTYDVLPGAELYSHFPQAGVISLDLNFGIGINLDAVICPPFIDCDTIPIIDVNVPTDSIIIFYLNGQTGETIYPCYDPGSPFGFSFCHDTILPITFNNLFGIGLSGSITLPYIETVDYLDTTDLCHKTLYANGDSTYVSLDLDIIQFLYAIAGLIPPPQGPAIQQFLTMLNGNYDLGGGFTVDYSLLTANMLISSTMQQDLTFSPSIWNHFSFPTPVNFEVTDPTNGDALVQSGTSDSIIWQACHDLHYQYPCFNWDQLDIGIAHSITPEFTNHTWDSIAFTIAVTALEFWINIPFPIFEPVKMPPLCIPAPYACAETKDSLIWCDSIVCAEEIFIGPMEENEEAAFAEACDEFGNFLKDNELRDIIHIGPLVDLSIPLGYIPLTWYNNTWNLAGFPDTIFPGETMIPNPELIITDISGNDVQCFGDSTGTLTLTIQYGTPPYTYSWSTGDTIVSGITTNTITGVPAGTWNVTISDVNGCSLTETFTLITLNPPIYINMQVTDVLCTGDATGSITSIVTGGTPGYSYVWAPTGGNAATASNLVAGTYTLTITDDAGCTLSDSAQVTEPPSVLAVTVSAIIDILCFGGNNGAIDIAVTGGSPGYTFVWSSNATTEDLSFITSGEYTVTVTDTHGCTATVTDTVFQPALLVADIFSTNVTCFGFANGTADLTVAGGTPPYIFNWNIGLISEDLSNLTAGLYLVTVTDAHGCTASDSVQIIEPLAPLSASIIGINVLCHGDATGSANLTVAGGTMPYSYNWSDGQITQNMTGVIAGNYTVTITDFYGCTLTANVVITEPANPLSLVLDVTHVRCWDEGNGMIDLSVSGGTPNYIYIWNNFNTNQDLTDLLAGTYSVTVTDLHGCTISDTVVVTEPDELIASLSGNITICLGQDTIIKVSATGGTPWYNYYWNTGSADSVIHVNPVSQAVYSVYVADSRGCVTDSISIIVFVNPPISATVNPQNAEICKGESFSFTVTANGGNGSYIYTLDLDTVPGPMVTIYPEQSEDFTVVVSDNCGSPVATVNPGVIVHEPPPVTFYPSITSGCQPLGVQFSEPNDDEGQTYLWNFGDPNSGNISDQKNPYHIYPEPGEYDVTLCVTSVQGCQGCLTMANLIEVYPTPLARFIVQPPVVNVVNPHVYFDNISENAYQYHWDFGDGDSSEMAEPEHYFPDDQPGSYNVQLIAESEYGCQDTTSSPVIVKGDFTFYAPTAFSPDDDGRNDLFMVYATGIKKDNFALMIYDRWGEIVFTSNDISEGWDGIVKNRKIAPVGTYTWIAIFKDEKNIGHQEAGAVTLIR